MKNILLSSAYLGPVQYYARIAQANKVVVEQHDHYHKQTYRNRCRVLAGNGPIDLTIPVVKNSGVKTPMKDVKIEYLMAWQDKHWRTLVSAYNSSPFFEYYRDDLQPFYEKKWTFLLDFNNEINRLILDLLEIDAAVELSKEYKHEFEGDDFREIISPKKSGLDGDFNAQPYTQTFSERFAFVPNLSIVDLLFNTGPEALSVLEASIVNQ